MNQLQNYHDRYKEKARETRRAYYLANREQMLAKAKAYYRAHRAQSIAKAIERNRRRFRIYKEGIRATRSTPAPPDDRQWWKPKPDEIPRRWILEAA